jgi:hypothetical protein
MVDLVVGRPDIVDSFRSAAEDPSTHGHRFAMHVRCCDLLFNESSE